MATTTKSPTMQVGERLVELCSTGENRKAIENLYADKVEVKESMPNPMFPNGVKTRDELLGSCDWFNENMEVHNASCEGPYPMGDDQFICFMGIDLTPKMGPMSGQRMEMKEAAVYTVKNGKITRSEFCYTVDGCEEGQGA